MRNLIEDIFEYILYVIVKHRTFTLLYCIFLFCQSDNTTLNIQKSERYLPELHRYVDNFYAFSKLYLPQNRKIVPKDKIVFYFDDTIAETWKTKKISIAICYRYYLPMKRRIVVDYNYWAFISEADKERIIFHELGHCALNREHRDDKKERFLPKKISESLMDSLIDYIPDHFYEQNRDEYLKELFTHP